MNKTRLHAFSAKLDEWLSHITEKNIRGLLERTTRSPRKTFALLAFICAMIYLPGINTVPPIDRDEPRYTQATKQMVETGDYTRMYFQEKFRNKKPIGIYWLQSLSVNLFGGESAKDVIWPYRMPSVLCAIGSVLLLYRLGCLLIGPAPALLAALLLAVAPLQLAISRVGTTDSCLLFATTLAQYNLVCVYMANRNKTKPFLGNMLCFWIAVGGGVLIKGPITPLIALLTSLSLMILHRDRHVLKGLRPWIGIPIVLAIVLPWLISIQIATDGAFLRDSFGGDFSKKLVSGQESHGAPPGFYTLLMAATCWPASLLIIPVLADLWRNRRGYALATLGFSWIIPYLILIECVPTKLPHYIMGIYPPLILLCVRFAWEKKSETLHNRFWKALHWIYSNVWIILFPLAAVAVLLTAVLNRFPLLSILAALLMGVGALLMKRLATRSALCRLAGCIPLLAAASILMFGIIMPNLRTLWVSRTVAEAFNEIKATHPEARLYAVGYHEPSLVFLTETTTRLCRKSHIEKEYGPNMVAFMPQDMASEMTLPLIQIAEVKGINYSKGKWVNAGLYIHPKLEQMELAQVTAAE